MTTRSAPYRRIRSCFSSVATAGTKDPGRLSQFPRRESHGCAMIAARSRDHACLGNVARQQVGEGAACFERTCMLQQFQLEDDADTVEAEVGAIDFDDRCPADVGANEFVRP